MKIAIGTACFVFFILLFQSCTFENEVDYFGEPVCDSTKVNRDSLKVYYEDLTYIFNGVCQECHKSLEETPRGGIAMDSYENVVASIKTGKVLPAIKHEGRYLMPYQQPKLLDCEIQNIAIWIEKGMQKKNN